MGDCSYPDDCRGTRSCYVWQGCRGDACRAAERDYGRTRKRKAKRPDSVPRAALVSCGQLRTHIAELRAAGVGYYQIGRRAGVSGDRVSLIGRGIQKQCSPEVKERIMAVMPSMIAPNALVDAGPTHERIEALLEFGWTDLEIARAALGQHVRARHGSYELGRILMSDRVKRRVEDAVRRLYDEEFPEDPSTEDDIFDELRLLASDDSWREDAECRRSAGDARERQGPFFPIRGDSLTPAREICGRCPVALDCLEFALSMPSHVSQQGIWGGTSGGERRLIRRLGWDAAEALAAAEAEPSVPLIDLLEHEAARMAAAS